MISTFMKSRMDEPSSIREAFELAERLKLEYGEDSVFDFSIGNPTAPCPLGVQQALSETLSISSPITHGYMQCSGYENVRRSVAESLNNRFEATYTEDDIIMTTGAACALNVLMRTILDPGDEVIVFLPCYPAYLVFADNCGAKTVKIPFESGTLLPDLDAFESMITSATKMVLVNTPHNPTGLVYPDVVVHGIVDVLMRQRDNGHNIMLVSDEPYRELAFDGTKVPWWPSLYSNTSVVYSWSKAASVAGERIGYLTLPAQEPDVGLMRRGVCRALGDLGFVNAPATAQRIALSCVEDIVDVSYYDRNRLALYEGLVSCGFSPIRGNGAFYLLLPAPDGDEGLFVERLAEKHVVVVAGASFGCPGFVRLSYCVPPETIEASLDSFRQVASSYFG